MWQELKSVAQEEVWSSLYYLASQIELCVSAGCQGLFGLRPLIALQSRDLIGGCQGDWQIFDLSFHSCYYLSLCFRHFAFISVILLSWLPFSQLLALLCKAEGLVCILDYLSENWPYLDLFSWTWIPPPSWIWTFPPGPAFFVLDLDLWTLPHLDFAIQSWFWKSSIFDQECGYFFFGSIVCIWNLYFY